MKRLERGRLGETLASSYLEAKGYRIAARNYRIGHLELDLVCESDTHLLFVEVKTRTKTEAPLRYGRPACAVDERKKQHLRDAANAYLRERPSEKRKRIDVIEVYLTPSGALAPEGIHHIENALL